MNAKVAWFGHKQCHKCVGYQRSSSPSQSPLSSASPLASSSPAASASPVASPSPAFSASPTGSPFRIYYPQDPSPPGLLGTNGAPVNISSFSIPLPFLFEVFHNPLLTWPGQFLRDRIFLYQRTTPQRPGLNWESSPQTYPN